jgi:hypothetical protein
LQHDTMKFLEIG